MIVSKLPILHLTVVTALFGAGAPGAARLPFTFVENKGQSAPEVKFVGEGPGFKAWFEDRSVIFQQGAASTRMTFAGAREQARYVPADPIGARANYFRGNDPDSWVTDLEMYGSLSYHNVWSGIDVEFHRNQTGAKTEYIVAPGASAAQIRLRFQGKVDISNGELRVTNATGEYRESAPVIYQGETQGDDSPRRVVDGHYVIYSDDSVGFIAGSYDHTRTLVIDPAIVFSGYVGGSSQSTINAVAVNSYYNVVVAGWTISSNMPTTGGVQLKDAGGVDAFIAGFSPAGGQLLFCTYLGGSGDDRAFGIAVDSSNNTYVTGWTSSSNFPTANALQRKLGGSRDAFVAKLNPSGNTLLFSTYLGGSGVDAGYGIVLDSNGEPVITGDTNSSNLSVTPGVVQSSLMGGQNAFVAKLTATGTSLVFLTYFGGNGTDHSAVVKVDASNAVFIGGSTYSTNFPVLNAFQPYNAGGQDAFITKLSADAKTVIFSSYYGGSGGSAGAPEEINSIVVPADSGNPNVGGTTSSVDFPTTKNCLQATFGGGQTDGFLGRINGATGALQNSTYVGGSGDDGINAVDIDVFHRVYAAGYTDSNDFPAMNPIQSSNAGGMDAFIYKTNMVTEEWATYLGGNGNDSANAIAVDSLTNLVVAGVTGSSKFPIKGSVGTWPGSQLTSFITKIAAFNTAVVAPPAWIEDIWHNTGYNGPSNLTLGVYSFGAAGDIPVSGDWTGTGVRRIGSFRNGTWYLDINGNGVFDAGDQTVVFGQAGDVPVVGDWNGTGKIKLGLFRQGTFILDLSGHLSGVATGVSDATFSFGQAGDIPVVCDWNRSGFAKVGVFRSGLWIVDYTGNHIMATGPTYNYGQSGDRPVVGDWDGSGVPHLGVYRQGLWILDYAGYYSLYSPYQTYNLVFTFGGAGYVPMIM